MRREVLLAFCVLLAVATAACAVPIDGMVLVNAVDAGGYYSYFMDGDTDTSIAAPDQFRYGRMSPTLDKVVYYLRDAAPPTWAEIWTANLDGSDAVNVTADLGAVNCNPEWSPDSSQIAFHRSVLKPGLSPCESGFEVWVMDADGADAHRVSPLGVFAVDPSWASDGYRIICGGSAGTCIVDSDGTDWQALPEVGGQATWSPDSTHIASITYTPEVIGSESGVWRNLLLTDGEGRNPVTLREHFVRDSDIATYFEQDRPPEPEGTDPYVSLRMFIGVNNPTWSPRGDQLMFREIADFDPLGIGYQFQTELWLYDVATDTFTQLTRNEVAECETSWGGYNTKPDQLEVRIGAVTIAFDQVIEPGVTVVLRDDDPPDVDGGLYFNGCYYEIHTTAEITGPVTICMEYSDAAVPPGVPEEGLAIVHWDGKAWVDATVSRNAAENMICAQVASLSPIALRGAREAMFPDVPAWGYGDDGLDPFWAYYAIQSCADGGVVAGYEDGTYQPSSGVDRAQMAVYVARAVAGNDGSVPPFDGAPSFPDVGDGHWALKYVEFAVAQNIVAGYPDGHYYPTASVTRDQMAVYIARAMVAPAGDAGVPEWTEAPTFPDVAETSWAFDHIQFCAGEGVVQGYEDALYHPELTVTRDQMAVYVARSILWR